MNKILIYLLALLLPYNCIADDTELFVYNGGNTNVLIMFNLTDWYGGTNFIEATKTSVKKFLDNTSNINVAIVTTKNIFYRYTYRSDYWYLTPTVLSHFKPVKTSINELKAHVDTITSINNSGIDQDLLITAWEYFSGLSHFNDKIRIEDSAAINNNNFVSPILSGCNNNFVLLFTRAYSSYSSVVAGHINNVLAPRYNCPSYLSEYAKMGWIFGNADAAPTIAGNQHLKLFPVFMPQSSANKSNLNYASQLSGGLSFDINQIDDLTAAMETVRDIIIKGSTIVSPVISTDAFGFHTQDKKIYFALFKPEEGVAWKGNLKCYKMGADGIMYDKNNNPAIDDNTGFFKTTSHSFWSSTADGDDVLAGGMAENISQNRKIYSDILDSSYTHYSGSGTVLSDAGNKVHENNTNITTTMLGITTTTDPDTERNAILKWARGVDIDDYNNDGDTTDNRLSIGDPLHTKPLLVKYYDNDETIYLTTNDGFLHAVDPTNGNTTFSFIPRDLLQNLSVAKNNPAGLNKLYGLDAPMTALRFDANADGNILQSAGGAVSFGESILLALPMRRGGRNIYCLNVSDRQNPKLSWTIRGGKTSAQQTTKLLKNGVTEGIGDFMKLGQTWSIAMPAIVKWQGSPKVVLFFGGGYDEQTDNQTTIEKNTMGNAIFMVDAVTGEKLWQASVDTNNGTNLVIPNMEYSIVSNLTLVDIDKDGFTDFIIATDVGGQVFRIDINNNNIGPASFATGSVIAQLSDKTLSGSRRFFESANVSIASNNSHLNIAIGSGFRASPNSTYTQDRIYVIKDKHVFNKPTNYIYGNGNVIMTTDLYNATDNLIQSGTVSQKNSAQTSLYNSSGWYIDLEDAGEKLFSKLQTYGGVLTFTTYVPPNVLNANSCQTDTGTSYLYALNIENGAAVSNLSGGSTLGKNDRRKQLKLFIAPEPSIINNGQNGIRVCVGTECFDDIIPNTLQYIKKAYWRENR